jgi:hypothetical protein
MDDFLTLRGFIPLQLPKIKERVYGKIVYPKICVRVYTGIVGEDSRGCGSDAIRVVAVKRMQDKQIKPVSPADSKVYRLENWKANLTIRIDNVIDMVFADIERKKEVYA